MHRTISTVGAAFSFYVLATAAFTFVGSSRIRSPPAMFTGLPRELYAAYAYVRAWCMRRELLGRVAQSVAREDCSEGLLNAVLRGNAQKECSEWVSYGMLKWVSYTAYAGLMLGSGFGEHSDVLVGNVHTAWQGLQAIARVLVRWNGRARGDSVSRGRCAELCAHCWPYGVCWWKTTWLGSYVPHVAGARIHASSAKLVWDVMACGAYGASATRGRARGVAG